MKEKKTDNSILEDYIKFADQNRNNIELLKQYVEYYKNKYKIDIDIVFMHTDTDDVTKLQHWYGTSEYDLCEKMQLKTDKDEINNEPKILKGVLDKDSDKPRGVIICLLDRKNNIQHAFSYVIDNKQNENDGKFIMLSDGNGLDSGLLYKLLTARSTVNGAQYDFDYTIQSSKMLQYMGERFNFQQVYPQLKQQTIICYLLATSFCVEMLKRNCEEFKKCVQNNYVLPLSLLRYSQNYGDFFNHYDVGYLIMSGITDWKKQQKYTQDINESTIKNNDGTAMNVFAMKKLFKYLKNNWKQIDGYENIINGVIAGTLKDEDRKYFKSEVSLVEELKKYNFFHNNIINNNSKNIRIKHLAQMLNGVWNENIKSEKEQGFNKNENKIKEVQNITFDDLLNISNIKKKCCFIQ